MNKLKKIFNGIGMFLQKAMKQGRNVHGISSFDACSKSWPCNIKGVWSHLGDMPTWFLCSVVLHLYWPTASFYLYYIRRHFRGLTEVSMIVLLWWCLILPPNSFHQVPCGMLQWMLWAELISWFKWLACIPPNVKSLQHASRDKIMRTKTE